MWRINKHHSIGLGALAIIFIFAIAIVYGYLRGTLAVRGMSVNLENLKNGMTDTDATLTLRGQTEHVNNIFINGRQVYLSPDGSFTDVIAPLAGFNILNVTAQNRLGKTKILTYRFLYTPLVPTALQTTIDILPISS